MHEYPIYCINLEHRKDRKEHSLTQFTELGVPHEKVIYPHFTKDARGGVYGCFDSHMKVWNDFLTKYPNEKYCLVFEDDFVISKNTKSTIKKASKFIDENYDNIDILVLHNSRISTDNKLNNELFTNGYGWGAQACFITRHYIESIITKYGKLPEANGRHIDIELNMNIVDKDNWVYTEKMFYTNKKYVSQLIDKGDNCKNMTDDFFRTDINKITYYAIKSLLLLKKFNLSNDTQIKQIVYNTVKLSELT
jgi:GR25 family glycosyltransferase involved in LPS biosynthesis